MVLPYNNLVPNYFGAGYDQNIALAIADHRFQLPVIISKKEVPTFTSRLATQLSFLKF